MVPIELMRRNPMFRDVPEDHLRWLCEQGEMVNAEADEILFHEGDPVDFMFVFFEGEVRLRLDGPNDNGRSILMKAGDVSGLLPYSRMKRAASTGRALVRTSVGRFHKRIFPELISRMPELGERLVGLMMDRVRENTRLSEQQTKLVALGKLSAGLAHELNNPAGAATRAAAYLKQVRAELREAYVRLDCRELSTDQRSFIARFENAALERVVKAPPVPANSLEQMDREEELLDWMGSHNVADAHKYASVLVESGITIPLLEDLVAEVGIESVADVVNRMHLVITAYRLVNEIELCTNRITEIVKAVKDYTYMDQAPEQEIDVHDGIESTLTILAFKLRKKSIHVVREFDRRVPKICAYGAELNQVWTNLIVNAVEAMQEGGELRIKTWCEPEDILVEVRDNGSGMTKEVKERLFEPFFTTKGVGEGTGLGLDTVQRIIRKHRGEITVESAPGDTRFRVRLPKQGVK